MTQEIENRIYRFWARIGSENNDPNLLIKKLLENMKLPEKKKIKFKYETFEALKNCNIDNSGIINLNNGINDINNFNNNIQINEIQNDINLNDNNEEDEVDNDEEEIFENEDNLKYMQYNGIDNMDDFFNQEKENEEVEEEDELLDENNLNFRNLNPLNEEQFNSLINSNHNFFKLGPKIVKLLIEYMKNILLQKELNEENQNYDLDEYSELLNKKNEMSLIDDAEIIKKSKKVCMTTTACAKY